MSHLWIRIHFFNKCIYAVISTVFSHIAQQYKVKYSFGCSFVLFIVLKWKEKKFYF